MKKVFALVCAVPFVVVFACGGGDKPVENPTNVTPSATATDSAASSASAATSASAAPSTSAAPSASVAAAPSWKTMTHEQKMGIMKSKVLPKMSEDFMAVDKKKYAEFSCKTCHGDAAVKDGSFKMPNPKLPKLPTDPAGFKALSTKKPEVMKFMMEKVKPDMVSLLGVEAYEPGKNETGFGCYNCHEKAEAAPAKK
jgi:hypothetical protein